MRYIKLIIVAVVVIFISCSGDKVKNKDIEYLKQQITKIKIQQIKETNSEFVKYPKTKVNTPRYIIQLDDYLIDVLYTAIGIVDIELPSAKNNKNRKLIIRDGGLNACVNNINIHPYKNDLIWGCNLFVINTDYGSLHLYSDGVEWYYY